MQILFRAFLAIYLAHLLTDFVFQTHRLVEQKRRGNFAAYLLHGLIHYLSAVTLVHLLIDLAKIQLAKKHPVFDGSWAYVSDQLLHFLTVSLAAWLLSPAVPLSELSSLIQNSRAIPNKFLAVPVI